MAIFSCFNFQFGKKKEKGLKRPLEASSNSCNEEVPQALQVILGPSGKDPSTTYVMVPLGMKGNSKSKVKVMSHESPAYGGDALDAAYEGEDEHEASSPGRDEREEESSPMKRNYSDCELQANVGNSGEEELHTSTGKHKLLHNTSARGAETSCDALESGHLSDPGIAKAEFWASPRLKRSCSNLESKGMLKKIAHQLPTSRSQSFEELQDLAAEFPGSPGSVMSRCSADKVMLKKHSSSQVLPSRSRRLWWKLFLWSHRNLHKTSGVKPYLVLADHDLDQRGGYSSDTLEPSRNSQPRKLKSPGSFTGDSGNEGCHNGFHGLSHHNQWVAFSTDSSSSFRRVEEWVKDLESTTPVPRERGNIKEEGSAFPSPPDTCRSPARSTSHSFRHPNRNISEELLHANSIVQSLNTSSTVAHISGIGLKVIPALSCFSSLRTVNLSSNFIVHMAPGSLPRGLHTLNLSRNRISSIEGLRELTRLRVLDLSYNRISRIGHGLSRCTLIKELYLSGNKISDLEGLHRLLKLTVLDLSFNKITTTRGLGQLVANYNTLLALNLLGNPIQSNMSEDQLRKAACGLLPKLTYLNKQPLKPQRAREVLMDNVAKAALRDGGGRYPQRKVATRGSQSAHKGSLSAAYRSRSKSKSRSQHQSPLRISSSAIAP